MSLIMDALKRAQQLRLKESKGTPFFKNPSPKNRRGRRSLGKRWIVIGAVLASLVIVIFVFLKPVSPPLTSKPGRAVALIEKKAPLPAVEKKPQEPTKEIASPEFIEGPKDVLSKPKDILSQPKETSLQGAKATSGIEPPVNLSTPRPKGDSLSVAERVKPRPKRPVKKGLSPTPAHLASLKGEALSKPTGTEKEEGKDRPIVTEAIHYFNSAVSFYNQRETSRAIQAYQKAIELNPASIEAYNNLGIIYQEMGDFGRAVEAYQKAIEINPQYEKAYNNLGILLFLKGRLEEATEAFQKALAINPNNVESLINLGVLFRKQGQSEKGIESYQRALAINPFQGETHYNIGLLYEEMENVELAVDHYQKFIQLSSKTYPVLASKVQSRVNYLSKVKNSKSGSPTN